MGSGKLTDTMLTLLSNSHDPRDLHHKHSSNYYYFFVLFLRVDFQHCSAKNPVAGMCPLRFSFLLSLAHNSHSFPGEFPVLLHFANYFLLLFKSCADHWVTWTPWLVHSVAHQTFPGRIVASCAQFLFGSLCSSPVCVKQRATLSL